MSWSAQLEWSLASREMDEPELHEDRHGGSEWRLLPTCLPARIGKISPLKLSPPCWARQPASPVAESRSQVHALAESTGRWTFRLLRTGWGMVGRLEGKSLMSHPRSNVQVGAGHPGQFHCQQGAT